MGEENNQLLPEGISLENNTYIYSPPTTKLNRFFKIRRKFRRRLKKDPELQKFMEKYNLSFGTTRDNKFSPIKYALLTPEQEAEKLKLLKTKVGGGGGGGYKEDDDNNIIEMDGDEEMDEDTDSYMSFLKNQEMNWEEWMKLQGLKNRPQRRSN